MTAASASARRRPGGPETKSRPIALMIVDDSPIARTVLSRMLSAHTDFEVVAQAGNAGEALDALKSVAVDIVLLDVEMPGTTGLQALPEILRRGNGARVLIVSSNCEDGAEATVNALALGAADTLPKPGTGRFAGRFSEVLAERLRRIGYADRGAVAPGAAPADLIPIRLRAMPDFKLACLALGASTGGLHALGSFLKALPEKIGAPILVTQHLPPVFMPYFARQLEAACGRHAQVAEEGTLFQPERIYIAPGDAHLCMHRVGGKVRARLDRTPASSGCKPSVDSMFWSLSEIYGKGGVGVVFSGMGRDGLVGSARIVDRGGAVLVQDRATAAIWGMPRAVAEAGLASAILSPTDLAARIAACVQGGSWK
ncbi:chemotaxis-specific protein-glutamate methyltransferase CheB [Allosphingosinicella humi]